MNSLTVERIQTLCQNLNLINFEVIVDTKKYLHIQAETTKDIKTEVTRLWNEQQRFQEGGYFLSESCGGKLSYILDDEKCNKLYYIWIDNTITCEEWKTVAIHYRTYHKIGYSEWLTPFGRISHRTREDKWAFSYYFPNTSEWILFAQKFGGKKDDSTSTHIRISFETICQLWSFLSVVPTYIKNLKEEYIKEYIY